MERGDKWQGRRAREAAERATESTQPANDAFRKKCPSPFFSLQSLSRLVLVVLFGELKVMPYTWFHL